MLSVHLRAPAPTAPLVSVVIPAYNHARYIVAALDSVIDEGYSNLEILVLDDGSRDDTFATAVAWAQGNRTIPIQVLHQRNTGLTTTLNRLIQVAAGEFVVYLASDDRLLPGGIQARVNYLQQHPEMTAVFGDSRMINGRGDVVRERCLTPAAARRAESDVVREIVANWAVMGCVILYRRNRVRELGGYDTTLRLEDWDFYLRLAANGEIAYVDRLVADYRWHGENTVANADQAIRLAEELQHVAWRSRRLFGGHLYLELVHETASWAARVAWLRRRPVRWLGWKAASVGMKLLALVVPRRPTDQLGRRDSVSWRSAR